MEGTNLDLNETVDSEDAQELEPMLLARVTEATRGGGGGGGEDNIVWGYFPS